MPTIQDGSAHLIERSDGTTDLPAVRLGFSVLEADLSAGGGAVSVARVTLSDGTERVIALYAADAADVGSMASNSGKREAIGRAVGDACVDL